MRVLIIWDGDYPWDVRVEKISRTLFRNQFYVAVVCRNLERRPSLELIDGVWFYRLHSFVNKYFNQAFSFPFFLNPLWLKTIYSVAKETNSQVILVRDLPLAISAIIIGRILNIPVAIDMAENYPAMVKDSRRYGKFKWGNFLVRNIFLVKLVERYAIEKILKFIVVTEENRRRLIQSGVSETDIYIVSNTPDLEEYYKTRQSINNNEKIFYKERFTIIYVGGLGPIRGLETVIKAMPKIVKKIPKAHLLLIGKGEKLDTLKRLAEIYEINEHVTFKGWLDFQFVPQYIECSSVGIIPHRSTEHTNTTIPNKIFDYMALGLPVIASDTAPMQRIIQKEKCGVIFRAGNPEDFAQAVCRVFEDGGSEYGRKGQKAVKERYNWETDSTALLRMFKDLERFNKTEYRSI